MNLPDAIDHVQRFHMDCAASPPHLMPRPSIEVRHAIAVLLTFALAIKPNKHAAPILDSNDMSGCA